MKRTSLAQMLAPALLALGLVPGAQAAEFWLCAAAAVKTMPDGAQITVWGYAQDDNANLADGCGSGTVQVPGPMLTVPPGDSTLTIHLANLLPALSGAPVPTSVVIPGQSASMRPVYLANGRVRSFTHETPPGSTGDYVWNGLQPGSYVYHSGTHPAVQVQMGLYGGIKHDQAPGMIYPGVGYDAEVSLFYSEIDPDMHAAVASGAYGGTTYPSTVDYKPRYFLVNGQPYGGNAPPLGAGVAGQRLLMRFFNMGLETHVPVAQGLELNAVAEDGRPYAYPRRQYSLELPAGKTRDVITVAPGAGSYPVYDRSLDLSNAGSGPGGLMSFLNVGNNVLLGQRGDASVGSTWASITLTGMQSPVIIAGPPSYNGTQPGIIRLRNVTGTRFQARFEEWAYLDQWHGNEQFSWLALEPGRYQLGDGSIWEVGTLSLDGTGVWKNQSFAQAFPGNPALFLTGQTANGSRPVTVRARSVGSAGFQAALFAEEALMDGGHVAETVGYLAVWHPTGTGSVDLGNAANTLRLGSASVGSNGFVPVLSGTYRLRMEEEQSRDLEVFHLNEQMSVMELGTGLFAQDVSSFGRDTAAPRRRP